MFNKKALSSVITISLLLIVTTFSFVYLQSFFTTLSSDLSVELESPSNEKLDYKIIDRIFNQNLYLKIDQPLEINSVFIDRVDCGISGFVSSNVNYNISTCLTSVSANPAEVVLTTDKGVVSRFLLTHQTGIDYSVFSSCTLDGVEVGHLGSRYFYLSNSITYGETCQREIRTCNDGFLNGDINYNYSVCYQEILEPFISTWDILL